MVQQNCQGETANSENTLQGGNRPYGVKISADNFKVNGESLNRQNPQMTLKHVPIFCRSKVTSSVVITICSLKYIDVTRCTHTDLDVMQEKRIHYYHSRRNQFERSREVLELISRFEFEFRRCEKLFFEGFEFLVCSKFNHTHTMWPYMCLCCGLFVTTQFQFECCGVRDSW